MALSRCKLGAFLLLSSCFLYTQAFVMFCYFPNWARYRVSPLSRYDVAQVDPSLCTHIVYAFGAIDIDTPQIVHIDSNADIPQIQQLNALKQNNTELKTLLSLGGENAKSEKFEAITRDNTTLSTFAQNAVTFLRQSGFDGLDIDWEYPNADTKNDYSSLLETLRMTFDTEVLNEGQERLLLTTALPAGGHRIDPGFDIDVINRAVDLAGLMTYDYHGTWNTMTGFNSPLYSRTSNVQFNQQLSTDWTLQHYLTNGLSANKVLVGVTGAGTYFKLQDTENTGVGAPASNPAGSGDLWQLWGRYVYPEICQVLEANNSHRVFDEEQQVPYAYQGDDWFGYEDVHSIKNKVAYMVKQGVAGALFWSLDMDDFAGTLCSQGAYPLLRAFRQGLDKITTPTLPTTTTTTTPTSSTAPSTTGTDEDGTGAGNARGWSPFLVMLCLGVWGLFLAF